MAREYLFRETINVSGNIVEFGVFNETSLFEFLKFKKIIGFDFFNDKIVITDKQDKKYMTELYNNANFKGFTTEYIYKLVKNFECLKDKDIKLIKENVMETLDKYLNDKLGFRISLLHMDLDVDESTYYVLEKLYLFMVKESIIAFDEYNLSKWTESNTVDRFIKNHQELKLETIDWFEYPSAIIRIN